MAIAEPAPPYIPPEKPEVYADFTELIRDSLTSLELCNCYEYVKTHFPTLPPTLSILTNIKPEGDVVVFYYPETNLYHFARKVKETDTHLLVDETNYTSCTHSYRQVPKNSPTILGYFTP